MCQTRRSADIVLQGFPGGSGRACRGFLEAQAGVCRGFPEAQAGARGASKHPQLLAAAFASGVATLALFLRRGAERGHPRGEDGVKHRKSVEAVGGASVVGQTASVSCSPRARLLSAAGEEGRSAFCPRPSVHLRPPLPTSPNCCRRRKCHPGSYYSSWAAASAAAQPGRER